MIEPLNETQQHWVESTFETLSVLASTVRGR